jgi:hypothetical protein
MIRRINRGTCASGLRRVVLCVVGALAGLSGAGVARAATSVFDGYESPAATGAYFAQNNTTFTDSEGRFYSGYTGIGTNSFGGAPRSGNQFLFIENFQDFEASVAQTYALDPGIYTLSYYEGGREAPFGALSYNLVVDGVVRGSFITDSAGGAPSVLRTIPSFEVGPSGMTTITFQGTEPNDDDNMGFFDDLTITAVPEPAGLALVVLGGGLLLARRRRGA